MRTRQQGITIAGFAVLLVLAIAACAPAETPAASSPTPKPTVSATVPAVTPTPTVTKDPPNCENVLDPATLSGFEGFGYEQTQGFDQKMVDEDQFIAAFVEYGGILCQYGVPQSDNVQNFGFSPITDADAATQQAALVTQGLTVSTHDGAQLYSEPLVSEDLNGEQYLFVPGFWFFGPTIARVDEIRANVDVG